VVVADLYGARGSDAVVLDARAAFDCDRTRLSVRFLDSRSRCPGEHNDCTVRALAITAGWS
jgi:hypothetical protein